MTEDAPRIIQPTILTTVVLDTKGAGDNFTVAFFVGLLEKKLPSDNLKFVGCMLIFNSKYYPFFFVIFCFHIAKEIGEYMLGHSS